MIPQLWLDHFPASEWGKVADAHDPGQLERPLRERYWTMRTEMRRLGLRCELASGYRTPWQQWQLRTGRVPAGHEMDPNYHGSPVTALPGRSQHQLRRAADVDTTDAGYRWMRDNVRRFGLALTVASERWHIEARGAAMVPLTDHPAPNYDEHQEPDMPLSDQDINRIALVTAATVDKVLAKRFAALGLPVIAGVDKILQDDFAEVLAAVHEALDSEAAHHGPA